MATTQASTGHRVHFETNHHPSANGLKMRSRVQNSQDKNLFTSKIPLYFPRRIPQCIQRPLQTEITPLPNNTQHALTCEAKTPEWRNAKRSQDNPKKKPTRAPSHMSLEKTAQQWNTSATTTTTRTTPSHTPTYSGNTATVTTQQLPNA